MKKYKLICEYPSSPKLGEVVRYNGRGYTIKDSSVYYFPLETVENYPEFWKEIKDEYPKIISFRRTLDVGGGGFPKGTIWKITDTGKFIANDSPYNILSEEYLLQQNDHEIYQVAVSQDLVFKIGNKLKYTGNPPYVIKTIEKFIISSKSGEYLIHFIEDCLYKEGFKLAILDHYEYYKGFSFITEDGVEVFEGDNCAMVQIGTLEILYPTIYYQKDSKWKYFSTEEKAKEYVEQNKPKFSVKDIKDAMEYSKHKNDGEKCSIMSEIKLKQKLGI